MVGSLSAADSPRWLVWIIASLSMAWSVFVFFWFPPLVIFLQPPLPVLSIFVGVRSSMEQCTSVYASQSITVCLQSNFFVLFLFFCLLCLFSFVLFFLRFEICLRLGSPTRAFCCCVFVGTL